MLRTTSRKRTRRGERGRDTRTQRAPRAVNRAVQLGLGTVCMFMIANLQFGWTAFVAPLSAQTGWSQASIQVAFTIFVLVETWLVPFEAALVDRVGPRVTVIAGGVFAALGWTINGEIHTLAALYAGSTCAGIGAGLVYGTCVPNAVKWFARRRGLAVGVTVAGFGIGAALTVAPLLSMIAHAGPFRTFTVFGVLQGAVVVACGFFLVDPPRDTAAAPREAVRCLQGACETNVGQTLHSPVFWVMYLMFALVAAGGLMAVAQIAPIAGAFGVANAPLRIAVWTAPVLLLTLQLNNVVGGIARPLLGWISDYAGREKTLAAAFFIEGLGIWAFGRYGRTPLAFVLLAALVFFAWGEIYSIFPSLVRDHFGQRYAATNYGALYTAKGVGSLLVPVSGVITAATGNWSAALALSAVMNVAAAILAIGVLLPLRVREIARTSVHAPPDAAAAVAEALPL